MDNSNNSQNFSASPTTNDINAANQAAQNPPLAPADTTPTPTWLPPTPGQVGQQHNPSPVTVNPFSAAPPTPQAAATDPIAWPAPTRSSDRGEPSTPQNHAGTSPNAGWNPSEPSAPTPETQPLSPMNSSAGNAFSSNLTSESAAPNPSWTPPSADQSPPNPPVTADPVSTAPAWTPPAVPPETSAYGAAPPQAIAPAWTPPASESSFAPAVSDPSANSVFPPQFQQPNTPSSNASYDPLAAASNPPTPPTSAWPTPPTDQSAGSFATPQPPLTQAGSTPASSPAFVPSMENPSAPTDQSIGFGMQPVAPSAPTVPDFISNLNSQSPAGGVSGAEQTTPGFGSVPDSNPTDLSGVGSPINNSVYSPTIDSQEPANPADGGAAPPEAVAPVSPSGIPETVANVNKPKLSKMLIIIGLAAILLVAASASYLLFFGPKPGTPEDTISLPVSNQAPLTKPKEITTPAPDTTVATSPASTPDASPSGSSAFDLLKKAKTATPSPSPK